MLSISAVIVSYNSERFLKKNIESLLSQKKELKQIIVVDNNSSDSSRQICTEFEKVELIPLPENIGYSAALNRGIRDVDSDLLIIANPDVYFDIDFSSLTVEKFEDDPGIDLMSPLILRFEKDIIDSSGQFPSLSLFPVERGFGSNTKNRSFKEEKIFSVCGAVTVFRTKSLEKLKVDGEYYDESFFLFWEDFDIGWRANLLNFKIVFFPDSIAYHFRGGTMEKKFITRFSMALGRSSEIKFHLIKNRYLTLIKNFRFKNDWSHIPFIILKDIVWVGMLTLSSPKIIIRFIELPRFFRIAWRKRKILKANE